MKDYWFVWFDDYEPIRIILESSQIVSATHRYHWKHIEVPEPYTNDSNRIEAFFYPYTHTPKIRKTKQDAYFDILIKSFASPKLERYDITDESVPDYFTCAGKKERHFPSVEYGGWPELV